MHALLCVRVFAVGLRGEGGDEQSVGGPGDDDVSVGFDEFPGFFVGSEGQVGEGFEGGC